MEGSETNELVRKWMEKEVLRWDTFTRQLESTKDVDKDMKV